MTDELGDRSKYLGGSELGAILGLSKFATPLEVYLRKTGEAEPDDGDTLNREVGHALEPVLKRRYEANNGTTVEKVPEVTIEGYPFLRLHPDGRTVARLWEAKSAVYSTEWGEPGTDAIPEGYLVQTQVYTAALDLKMFDVSVLFGGRNYAEYYGHVDPELVRMILEAAADFWRRVQTRDPPDPLTYSDIRKRWPKDSGTAVVATPEMILTARQLHSQKAIIKTYEQATEAMAGELQRYMTDNSTLVDADGVPIATWKKAKDSTVTDWMAIAGELLNQYTYPLDLLEREKLFARHTTTKAGSRRFLLKLKDDDNG